VTNPRTLYEKIWDAHVISRREDGQCLVWIDRHLTHEVTSPQAFDGLRLAGRRVRRPDLTIATADHNVPTTPGPIDDPESAAQLAALDRNAAEFGVELLPRGHADQGIVHVIGPELGLTLPGLTIVCGDSHTATHGALGALAFGIGTSEVEHVLATQTLWLKQAKTLAVRVDGATGFGVGAKDIALAVCGTLGTAGGTGHVIEYMGDAITALSIEGRMTVANMAIEAGARAGLIAPDEKTFAYLHGRDRAPKGARWDQAVSYWRTLPTDPGAVFDREVRIDAGEIAPLVTWGTSPEDVVPVTGAVAVLKSSTTSRFVSGSKREIASSPGLSPASRSTDLPLVSAGVASRTRPSVAISLNSGLSVPKCALAVVLSVPSNRLSL